MENIFELLEPWKSKVMINKPWALPVFLIIAGILLSIFSWVRGHKVRRQNQ